MADDRRDEKRQYPRAPARLPVRFGTEHRMCNATIVDLSEGGLRIRTGETFPVNTAVTVFVQFPGGSFHLRARVARAGGNPPNLGLAFIQAQPALFRAYENWVAEAEGAADSGKMGGEPEVEPAVREEPEGPIQRRLETSQGSAYEILLERGPGGWSLTIFPSPRHPNVAAADFQEAFPDYGSADAALKKFLKAH